ncbi:MAG: 3-demethylubiquinone-9 3-O-methyltransferase [Halobacteriovoraceae bacterium]|nr:3-demethylubiquinone-9 3-O-methyltransferase [Halobacteriovoraceae bacterium]MBT5092946.1 3-demethylubiquinone-9 3-O-methyltransferase [Halobacteriovoraceae bacterium]
MKNKSQINNDFYEHLHDDWYNAVDDPVALLRAEHKVKNPWVTKIIKGEKRKILDIACGGGFLANHLAEEGHQVSGVDLSPSSLKTATSFDKTNTVAYSVCDAHHLPFEDNTFDVVCVMDFLEHVENPSLIVKEASRVLKEGGHFFFHTFSRNWISWFFVIKLVEFVLPKTPKNMHLLRLFIQPKELENFCLQNNLMVKEMVGIKPQFLSRIFWISLFQRKVHQDFKFSLTSNKLISYMGYAEKNCNEI